MKKFICAGICLGSSYLQCYLFPLAWVGVALLAYAIRRPNSYTHYFLGILLMFTTYHAIALHWIYWTARSYAEMSVLFSVASCIGTILICAILSTMSCSVGLAMLRKSVPIWLWLPPCWLASERLRYIISSFGYDDFLISQYKNIFVLRMLSLYGWELSLIMSLSILIGLGELIFTRQLRDSIPLIVALPILLVFMRSEKNRVNFNGIASIYTNEIPAPKLIQMPTDLKLIIWPEAILVTHPRFEAGNISQLVPIDEMPIGVEHIVGAYTRSRYGKQNSALHIDSTAHLRALRAKVLLAPIGERPLARIFSFGGNLAAGTEMTVFHAADLNIIPLICIEVFSGSLFRQGISNGGQIVAVLSSDKPYAGSVVALGQSIAALALHCAEFSVPAVRSSVGGDAVFIDADGRIACSGKPGKSLMLTCRGN